MEEKVTTSRSARYKRKRNSLFLPLIFLITLLLLMFTGENGSPSNQMISPDMQTLIEEPDNMNQTVLIPYKVPTINHETNKSEDALIQRDDSIEIQKTAQLQDEEREYTPTHIAEPPSIVENSTKEKQLNNKTETAVEKPTPQVQTKKQVVINHVVGKGQTVFSISRLYYLENKSQIILEFNRITNPEIQIKEGMELKIPDPDILKEVVVNKGETLFSISTKEYSRKNYLDLLMNYNDIKNPEQDVKAGMTIEVPEKNNISSHVIQPKQTIYSLLENHYDLSSIQHEIATFNRISNVHTDIKENMMLKIPNLFKAPPQEVSEKVQSDVDLYIEIDRAKNELKLYKNGKIHFNTKVATGENWSTPKGTFTITTKFKNPYYTPRKIGGGDPANPLGTRWLGLSVPGTVGRTYGIHGTNTPSSIGSFASIGCIRMLNQEIEWLYDQIPIGTKVVIL